jgi:hypothetical protein
MIFWFSKKLKISLTLGGDSENSPWIIVSLILLDRYKTTAFHKAGILKLLQQRVLDMPNQPFLEIYDILRKNITPKQTCSNFFFLPKDWYCLSMDLQLLFNEAVRLNSTLRPSLGAPNNPPFNIDFLEQRALTIYYWTNISNQIEKIPK